MKYVTVKKTNDKWNLRLMPAWKNTTLQLSLIHI